MKTKAPFHAQVVLATLLLLFPIFGFEARAYAAPKPVNRHNLNLALVHAVRRKDMAKAKVWLAKGADVNARTSNGNTLLNEALYKEGLDHDNLVMVRWLLHAGANPNLEDAYGNSPLAFAEGDTTILKLLLHHGVNIKSKAGTAALCEAAMVGNIASVKLLLAHGVDVNARRNYSEDFAETALMSAAAYSQVDVMRVLLAKGAKLDFRGVRGDTALMHSVRSIYPRATKFLLSQGAQVNAQNQRGETALMLAVEGSNKMEVIRLLLFYGANVNLGDKAGGTALMRAIKSPSAGLLQLLLNHKANINAQNQRGETVLIQAVQAQKAEAIKILLAASADVNLRDKSGQTAITHATTRIVPEVVGAFLTGARLSDDQRSLLLKAKRGLELISAADAGDATRVKALLSQDVDVNARDSDGKTALFWVAGKRRMRQGYYSIPDGDPLAVARLLLLQGANPEMGYQNEYGIYDTPLMEAAVALDLEMMRLLIENGASVDARNREGETALMLVASEREALPAIRLLLSRGADVNARDKFGNTPLLKTTISPLRRAAWFSPDPATVRVLRAAGADINAANKEGRTVLMEVAYARDTPAVKLLLDNGANVNARDARGTTALMSACRSFSVPTMSAAGSASRMPDVETARLLLLRGANVNARDKESVTALIEIARYNYRELHGPENFSDGHSDQSELVKARRAMVRRIAGLLIQHGAQVNGRSANGNTALKWAKFYGNAELTRLLTRAGAKAAI